jgi:hypothetical protein
MNPYATTVKIKDEKTKFQSHFVWSLTISIVSWLLPIPKNKGFENKTLLFFLKWNQLNASHSSKS